MAVDDARDVTAAPGSLASPAAARPAASVIVLAWNAWEHTRACLASLARTMAAGDELVVVDNGSQDETPAGLAEFAIDQLIVNEENLGFAAGANQGARAASRDVLVFLNNDTVVPAGWLDVLLEPFGEPAVVATGPRSNYVAGPQLVQPVPYAEPDGPLFEEFVQRWTASYGERCRRVTQLIGFCLAVRRSSFFDVGGFDEGYGLGNFEDNDLCHKLAATGGWLVIVDGAFVHHTGHATFRANDVDLLGLLNENQGRFTERWGPIAGATA